MTETGRGGGRRDDPEETDIDHQDLQVEQNADSAVGLPSAPQYLTRLSVRVDDRFVLLKMGEIRWIEAAGKHVRVHAGSQVYTLRDTLSRLGSLLHPESFLRISRDAVVNLDRVRAIEPWFHGDFRLRLDDGEILRSTKTFREDLKRLLQRRPRQG